MGNEKQIVDLPNLKNCILILFCFLFIFIMSCFFFQLPILISDQYFSGIRPPFNQRLVPGSDRPSRWIPAEHWQRQGMTAQEMTLPLDVVIPTNQPERGSIVLKAGQKVLVLKSPKGVYMQLESGKIVAIKTAIKVKGKPEESLPDAGKKPLQLPPSIKINPAPTAGAQKKVVKPFTPG